MVRRRTPRRHPKGPGWGSSLLFFSKTSSSSRPVEGVGPRTFSLQITLNRACMDRGRASPVPQMPRATWSAAPALWSERPTLLGSYTPSPGERRRRSTAHEPCGCVKTGGGSPSRGFRACLRSAGFGSRALDAHVTGPHRPRRALPVTLDAADQVVDLVVLAAIVVQPAGDLLDGVEDGRVVAAAELASDRRQ